jgi:hypothetical protein
MRRHGLKIIAAIAIIAFTAYGITLVLQPEQEAPVRGTSPAGYDEYAAAMDPEFCKNVALQLAALGDDPVLGFRGAGGPAEEQAAALLAQTMKDIGLENVTVDTANADGWTFGGANLTFEGADGTVTTTPLGGYQTNIVADQETLPVAYLGEGTASDYYGVDVTDKLVLIDIDQENEWWINYPAYQASLEGARAVIACSAMKQDMGSRIVSQDICGDADAPALAISSDSLAALREAIDENGYDDGGVKQIDAVFNASSVVTEDKGTRNIWGEIPGRTSDAILFIAHYDGYYHSFYDDASGVGTVLGIAKAMRESGVKPEKTLRFVLHGAEEWGRTGTEADWATGAYEQIVSIRPEWAARAFALFNVDSGYPLASMRSFNVNAPPELGDFVRSSIASFGDRSEMIASPDISPPSTYREDFIYNAMGTPTFAIEGGEGDEEYYASMYHSSADDISVGGYSDAGVLGIGRYIGYAALALDATPIRPLEFSSRFEALRKTLEDSSEPVFDSHLMANLDRAVDSAKALDDFVSGFNARYRIAMAEAEEPGSGGQDSAGGDGDQSIEEMREFAARVNSGIYDVYREMQDELLRLDRNLEPGFANEGLQHNITMLKAARDALMTGDADTAIYVYLSEIESTYAATAFDKRVCDKFIGGLDAAVKDTWADGRLASRACRADEVVRSLLKKVGDEAASALTVEPVTPAAGTGSSVTQDDADITPGSLSGPPEMNDADADPDGGGDTDEPDFTYEIHLLDILINMQEDALRAVYNSQETALAILMDSMNELLDTYAAEQD